MHMRQLGSKALHISTSPGHRPNLVQLGVPFGYGVREYLP